MVWTPIWAQCSQSVPILTPNKEDFSAYLNGILPQRDYFKRYTESLQKNINDLTPSRLTDSFGLLLPEGAYLCCTCSIENASKGFCHRFVAAYLLKDAGWTVILDGKTL